MLRKNYRPGGGIAKKFPAREFPENGERRLSVILQRGFPAGSSYSTLSRDRYYFRLSQGSSEKELYGFCSRFMKGSPLPGSDPVRDSPKLLNMFQAAENAGLGKVEFVKAGMFVPEMKPR
ncbi:hypothetical protein GF318_05280 [Candidatus Micrarchaeota archaeon]|nr:hypothetical protein [Candidatus Micrarchaeota archaeon]